MTENNIEENKKSNDRFVGPRKVEFVVVTEDKTHGGNEVVKITYDSGYEELMPKRAFENLVTDKPTDWNDLRGKNINGLVKELLAVIAEHHLKAEDVDVLKATLERELFNSFNRATHFLWTKDDKSFIPGTNTVLERTLIEADKIIKTIPQDEPKSEPKADESSSEAEDKSEDK